MNIRQEYLNYFKSKGHEVISSMPLVPDDPTLLFTNAGMVQFKDIFTGAIPKPSNPTATSCQLCIRAGGKHNDLENVGYTARHHTLFEMLGNFSFADYFKKEAIAYGWEFLTVNLELPIDKLWVTIHESDDEAFELWKEHISEDRIKRFGDKDNFWSMGDTGPCGPCSEIFYDQGAEHFSTEEDYLGGEGDRFLEIWNLVFMQYEQTKENGEIVRTPLPKPSIDTGMGLERVIAIKEGVLNNFDSSNFQPIIKKTAQLAGKEPTQETIGSFRVIADHLRAASFMLSQGILFGNEGRPYVNRRILRRAVRHGYLLGFRKAFMAELVDVLIAILGDHYTDLKDQAAFIKEQITLEEDRFYKTIESGMIIFNEELARTKEIFSGVVAFKLYDEKGFPLDLTEDMLRDRNLKVDNAKFNELMKVQKEQSKANWKGSGDEGNNGDFKILLEKYGVNEFVGYDTTSSQSKILTLLDENFKETASLTQDSTGWIMLDQTPFYAESGGQIGDSGSINSAVSVHTTKKFFDMNLSKVTVNNGTLNQNDTVSAVVINRKEVEKHHSATHLLQTALKQTLGDTVSQAGSLNDANRLRFDFTYPKAMSQEDIKKVETTVNQMIAQGLTGVMKELPIEQAKEEGAIAMFGEKYGDVVRVVNFGGVSIEFCGGTHVNDASEIGSFYIVKESGVSAGVRRIEAVCGLAAVNYTNEIITKMNAVQAEVKNSDVLTGIKKLKEQIKSLKNDVAEAQSASASPISEEMIGDTKIVVDIVKNGDIKKMVDDLKNANEKLAVLLIQPKGDKVMLVAGSKNTSVKAGNWIKEIAPIVGGGGGGRPDFAQAGGKDASKVEEAKTQALAYAKENL